MLFVQRAEDQRCSVSEASVDRETKQRVSFIVLLILFNSYGC
jgi:hypothetical protein